MEQQHGNRSRCDYLPMRQAVAGGRRSFVAQASKSLVPMAQEHRKPIFHLTPSDGAIGGHMSAVLDAARDFRQLAQRIAKRAKLQISES